MKVKETAKKPYGICPASMTIWNADQTYNKKGILGSYALRNNMFDVGAMLLIAVIGYFFLKLEIPIAPIVLALILGPLAESNLRRSLLLSQGSASIFFTRPICIFFLLLAVLSLCWPLLRKVLSHRPAVVKSIHRLTQLQGVPPLQRRDHPAFAGYFKSIWKELEVHEG